MTEEAVKHALRSVLEVECQCYKRGMCADEWHTIPNPTDKRRAKLFYGRDGGPQAGMLKFNLVRTSRADWSGTHDFLMAAANIGMYVKIDDARSASFVRVAVRPRDKNRLRELLEATEHLI